MDIKVTLDLEDSDQIRVDVAVRRIPSSRMLIGVQLPAEAIAKEPLLVIQREAYSQAAEILDAAADAVREKLRGM